MAPQNKDILRIDTNLNYRIAPASERLHGAISGDPLADYVGRPDIQQGILDKEASEQAASSNLGQQGKKNRQAEEERHEDFIAERRALVFGGSSQLFQREVAYPSDL